MNRRQFLRCAAGSAGAAVLPLGNALGAAGQGAERPNILFAISDDQSWCHTSFAGDPVVKTPAFDRVAREGVYFPNAFCSSPSCTPSRGAVLTGQDFWRLESGACLYGTLGAKFPVYPDLLEAAGYAVGFMRKGWGPGNVEAGGRKRNPAGNRFRNFGQFLKRVPRDKPFCFWFGSTDPHRGYVEGSGLKSGKKLEDVPLPPFLADAPEVRSDILDYYLEIERFDRQLGQMLALLEKRGRLDNTIVVITSDNGMPFPRCKTSLYDYGVRMPLAIRWPARAKGGRVVQDFVDLTDMAPTFLDAGGLKPPVEMTGRSLVPVLTSGKAGRVDPLRDKVVVGRERHGWNRDPHVGYPMRAIRTHRYLYIRNFHPERRPGFDIDGGPTRSYMFAHRDDPKGRHLHQLWFERRPAEELYDCEKDRFQIRNLAGQPQYAAVQKKLAAQLEAHLKKSGDPRMLGKGDVFDTYRYHGRASGMRLFKQFHKQESQKR